MSCRYQGSAQWEQASQNHEFYWILGTVLTLLLPMSTQFLCLAFAARNSRWIWPLTTAKTCKNIHTCAPRTGDTLHQQFQNNTMHNTLQQGQQRHNLPAYVFSAYLLAAFGSPWVGLLWFTRLEMIFYRLVTKVYLKFSLEIVVTRAHQISALTQVLWMLRGCGQLSMWKREN